MDVLYVLATDDRDDCICASRGVYPSGEPWRLQRSSHTKTLETAFYSGLDWWKDAVRRLLHVWAPPVRPFLFKGDNTVAQSRAYCVAEAGTSRLQIHRIIQQFPYISAADGEEGVDVGKERQNLTLVLAPADGCKVRLQSSA